MLSRNYKTLSFLSSKVAQLEVYLGGNKCQV